MGQDTGSGELCALSLPFADLPKKLFRRRLTPPAPLPHTQMHTILARDSRPNQVDDDRFCAYSRAMINIAPLGRPRVACLASLTNCARPQGYILRTYEFPPGEGGAYRREMCRDGREGGQGILMRFGWISRVCILASLLGSRESRKLEFLPLHSMDRSVPGPAPGPAPDQFWTNSGPSLD